MSLMVIFIIFYVTACGVKSNNTSKSPLRQTKDMAENVYDAIKNHDSEQLKEQFCERLQPGKETAVDKIYEYIDGEIETLETDFALNFRRGSRCPKIAFWQSKFPKNGSLFINYCDIFEKIV